MSTKLRHINVCWIVASLSLVGIPPISGGFVVNRAQEDRNRNAALSGKATECWEGKLRPVPGLAIYVLPSKKNPEIMSVLEKLRNFPPVETTEGNQAHIRLVGELIKRLKKSSAGQIVVKTDSLGGYRITQLRTGEAYILIAADWDKGDADEDYYFVPLVTEALHQSEKRYDFYMGPGTREECSGK